MRLRFKKRHKFNARGGYFCLSCFVEHSKINKKRPPKKCHCTGIVAWFASRMEHIHYVKLKLMEKGGAISNVEHQVRFALVINSKKVGHYVADFQFFDKHEQRFRIQDTKGVETDASRLRRKCAEAIYGMEVEIVR